METKEPAAWVERYPPKKYPWIAKLDQKVATFLDSTKAQRLDTLRVEEEICKIHPVYWMEEYGYIREGKSQGGAGLGVRVIPFRLNVEQRTIADRVCRYLVPDPWQRALILIEKFRKAGVSTLFAAFDYWFARFGKNLNAFVIADLAPHTDNIIEMISLFHERDKSPNKPAKVPMGGSKKGIRLSNGSVFEQDTGENENPGTSGTIQVCHMSENAKWRNPQAAETSLLNSVPRDGFVFVVKESTAKGLNKFKADVDEAVKGGSRWDFVFINWKDQEDCSLPVPVGVDLKMTQDELEIVAQYGLTPGNVLFRREQISLLGGDVNKFKQDFPLNFREPFLVTGSYYFNTDLVQKRINRIKFYIDFKCRGQQYAEETYPEMMVALKAESGGFAEAMRNLNVECTLPKMVQLSENAEAVTYLEKREGTLEEGCAEMYRAPVRGHQYVVAVDVAEGMESSEYVSDDSSISVFDGLTKEQVLSWGGKFDEEVTAKFAVWIARLYNDAVIVPETNNKCGGVLLQCLEELSYKRIFKRQIVNRRTQTFTEKIGWETRSNTKQDVCSRLKLDFKNGNCQVHGMKLLDQMLSFMDIRGKLNAATGYLDDEVMSASIALSVIEATPAMKNVRTRAARGDRFEEEPASRVDEEEESKRDREREEALRRY